MFGIEEGMNDVDFALEDDQAGNGPVTRWLVCRWEVEILPSQWSGARAAAVLGQSDFDAWIAANRPSDQAAYYASKPLAEREGIRRACLRAAP